MTDMIIKTIRYVRARRCALDNFCFPFGILIFLIYKIISWYGAGYILVVVDNADFFIQDAP
jgi:hypothetical protein